MRILTLIVVSTCFASSAFAELELLDPPPAAGTSTANTPATATPPAMVNGKFTVGYEGRGDYAKNAQLAKQTKDGPPPVSHQPVGAKVSTGTSENTVSAATQPVVAPVPAPVAPAVAAVTVPVPAPAKAGIKSRFASALGAAVILPSAQLQDINH